MKTKIKALLILRGQSNINMYVLNNSLIYQLKVSGFDQIRMIPTPMFRSATGRLPGPLMGLIAIVHTNRRSMWPTLGEWGQFPGEVSTCRKSYLGCDWVQNSYL
jgi:hypothetical protein